MNLNLNRYSQFALVGISLSIFLTISLMDDAFGSKYPYKAQMSGQNEVPPVQSSATGLAEFTAAENSTIKYRINATGISEAAGITSAHIYSGDKANNGEVVADLWKTPQSKDKDTAYGVIFRGNVTDSFLKGPLQGKSLDDLMSLMDSGDAYVNIHTTTNPNGEIRGQLSNVDVALESTNSSAGFSTLTE